MNHLHLLHLVEVHGQEVPHDEPEEVLIEAAAVEQGELPGRQRARRAAGRDVDVTRGDLGDVDARHGSHQLGEVLRRRVLNGLLVDDGHRRRRVDQLLFGLGGRNDDGFFVLLGLLRVLFRLLFWLGPPALSAAELAVEATARTGLERPSRSTKLRR